MSEYNKPLPLIDDDTRPYWEGAKQHQLLLRRCKQCGTHTHLAYDCPECFSTEMEWVPASGKGSVFSFNVFHQAYHPAFEKEIPYNTAVVELAEGPLMISNVVGCKNEELYIGMPLEVVFEDVTEEVSLPKFRPAK